MMDTPAPAYQVLARKWRPRTFDEVVGQDPVTRALRNAIETQRVAHAYIFAGLRGTGKTTVARILAKCLNCERGPSPTPCNACTPCNEINEGRCLDVLELDAASRTGVDNIRELQEVVSYAPARDRYKVLIIDEAHMLSKPAFNALLKTLEEPPPRVVFVLATTELHKILPTILSRCQTFEFRRVSPKQIAAHLERVCQEESIRISRSVIERIARAAEGSVRDALSILERVLAFSGKDVGDEEALQILGAVPADLLARMVEALAAGNAAEALRELDRALDEGRDLVHLWQELLAAFRDILMVKSLGGRDESLARPGDEMDRLEAATRDLQREDVLRMLQAWVDIELPLRTSAQPRFVMEAALVRLAALPRLRPLEDVLAELGGGATARGASQPSPHKTPQKKKAPAVTPAAPAESRAAAEPAKAPGSAPAPSGLIEAVRRRKPMAAAILEDGAKVSWNGKTVRVEPRPGASVLERRLRDAEFRSLLESCARDLGGPSTTLEIVSPGPPTDPAGPPGGSRRAQDRATAGADRRRRASRHHRLHRVEDPPVERFLETFGAQILDVRTLDGPPPGVETAHEPVEREE